MLLPDAVTFSRNVFLPITNVCKNQCRYCGFRRDPAHPEANLMAAEEVAKILDAGKRQDAPKPSSRLGKCQKSIHNSGNGSGILDTQA